MPGFRKVGEGATPPFDCPEKVRLAFAVGIDTHSI